MPVKAIAYDQIPAGAPIRRLYESDDLTGFIATVTGPRPRINSMLTYGEHPGMILNELTQKLFYGRTAR